MNTSEEIIIEVIDTGCGIPKSFRSSLFQPFRQADMSTTRSRQGTGLGLSIVKHLLQRMNGTIEVNSVEGEGSTFTVKLPVATSSDPPNVTLPQKRVKVVYSHEKTAKLLVDMWSQYGLAVSLGSTRSPPSELTKDVDAIWTDVESVRSSCALRDFMMAPQSFPPIYITHTDAFELSTLEPALSSARNVVVVKQPIIMHGVLGMLLNPGPYLGSDIASSVPGKVRFVLPPGAEKGKSRQVCAEPLPSLSCQHPKHGPTMPKRRRVLLVEDNIVSGMGMTSSTH